MNPPLVLASASPRRRELLGALRLAFSTHSVPVNEEQLAGEAPEALVRRLSHAKAAAVAACHPDAVIIGADTVVMLDGKVLGKPVDGEDALCMLRGLRDRRHVVLSALAVLNAVTGQQAIELSESQVWMRHYSDAEIVAYVASGDPLDKAGAYAIQHRGFAPVSRIEGCYTGVMGLPLGHLAAALGSVGITVPVDVAQACTVVTGYQCCLSARPGSC